jgi:hypothetical protein
MDTFSIPKETFTGKLHAVEGFFHPTPGQAKRENH